VNQGFGTDPRPRKLLFNPAITKFERERVNNSTCWFSCCMKRNCEEDDDECIEVCIDELEECFWEVDEDESCWSSVDVCIEA
jgi:hypothetical protein